MSISPTTEAFRFGFDFFKAFSALFNGQVGPDNLTLALRFTFTLALGTVEGCECCQLKLNGISNVLVIVGIT